MAFFDKKRKSLRTIMVFTTVGALLLSAVIGWKYAPLWLRFRLVSRSDETQILHVVRDTDEPREVLRKLWVLGLGSHKDSVWAGRTFTLLIHRDLQIAPMLGITDDEFHRDSQAFLIERYRHGAARESAAAASYLADAYRIRPEELAQKYKIRGNQ